MSQNNFNLMVYTTYINNCLWESKDNNKILYEQ